jgi:hypothetical protein
MRGRFDAGGLGSVLGAGFGGAGGSGVEGVVRSSPHAAVKTTAMKATIAANRKIFGSRQREPRTEILILDEYTIGAPCLA